jgi:hypothetical protein
MKIYFSATLSQADRLYRNKCLEIIDAFQSLGHQVFPENFAKKNHKTYRKQTEPESLAAQRELTQFKKDCDLVVYEVSRPSIGIGQEIALSLALHKPVMLLHDQNSQPHILRDVGRDLLVIVPYSRHSLRQEVEMAMSCINDLTDVRFNLIITREIYAYLEFASKHLKVPKSVFVRHLIIKHMNEDSSLI